jgi:hypothetical protein
MRSQRDWNFWLGLLIFAATIYLSIATYLRWLNFSFRIGPYYFTHWLAWIGTLYIAFSTPIYYILKRRRPGMLKKMLAIHMHGNLLSFMLISTHFFQQISRPTRFYPDLGTGIALYAIMLILVTTGFLHRFQILRSISPHHNRFLHISITTGYYIVIVVHILQGLGFL